MKVERRRTQGNLFTEDLGKNGGIALVSSKLYEAIYDMAVRKIRPYLKKLKRTRIEEAFQGFGRYELHLLRGNARLLVDDITLDGDVTARISLPLFGQAQLQEEILKILLPDLPENIGIIRGGVIELSLKLEKENRPVLVKVHSPNGFGERKIFVSYGEEKKFLKFLELFNIF